MDNQKNNPYEIIENIDDLVKEYNERVGGK